MPGGGKYYTQGSPGGTGNWLSESFAQQNQGQPLVSVGPDGKLVPYGGGQEGAYINIPAAPPQFIGMPGTEYQKTPDFTAAHPQGIADLSPLEQWAMLMTPGMWDRPEAEQQSMDYATQIGGAQVPSNVPYYQGSAFQESPFYQTGKTAFEEGIAPLIENQMALSGLGTSSSLANALSLGWGQQVPQILSQYATQYVEPQLQRQMQQQQLIASMIPQLAGLGAQETGRELQTINAALQAGGLERGVRQAQEDALYADLLRRQALSEQALFGPMGMLPSAVGSRTVSTTSAEGGGGGLFK